MGYNFDAELEAQAKEFGLWLERMVAEEEKNPTPDGNFMLEYGRSWRWLRPIGPAPEGWEAKPTCRNTIPHNDEAEQWMNDEMNEDHYVVA